MSIYAHQSGPWPHDFGGMGNGKNGVGLPINDQSAIQPLRKITLLVQILHLNIEPRMAQIILLKHEYFKDLS